MALCLHSPGCGTLLATSAEGPRPFGGVRATLRFVAEGAHWKVGFLNVLRPFAVLDLPLSLALDLVLLPISLPVHAAALGEGS